MTAKTREQEIAKEIVEHIYCPDYHWQKETERFLEFKEWLISRIAKVERETREETNKEIERLKKAAEEEFQRAEGKLEMKRWFQERLVEKDGEIERLKKEVEEWQDRSKHFLETRSDILSESDQLYQQLQEAKLRARAAEDIALQWYLAYVQTDIVTPGCVEGVRADVEKRVKELSQK